MRACYTPVPWFCAHIPFAVAGAVRHTRILHCTTFVTYFTTRLSTFYKTPAYGTRRIVLLLPWMERTTRYHCLPRVSAPVLHASRIRACCTSATATAVLSGSFSISICYPFTHVYLHSGFAYLSTHPFTTACASFLARSCCLILLPFCAFTVTTGTPAPDTWMLTFCGTTRQFTTTPTVRFKQVSSLLCHLPAANARAAERISTVTAVVVRRRGPATCAPPWHCRCLPPYADDAYRGHRLLHRLHNCSNTHGRTLCFCCHSFPPPPATCHLCLQTDTCVRAVITHALDLTPCLPLVSLTRYRFGTPRHCTTKPSCLRDDVLNNNSCGLTPVHRSFVDIFLAPSTPVTTTCLRHLLR